MPETATVQIPMPEMGESVTEGIVLEWHVAEGDAVKEGDTIVEVSTDKVDAEVPAPMDGVITKLVAQVDDEVPVGAPLAEMEPGSGEGPGAEGAGAVSDEPSAPTRGQWQRRRARYARGAQSGRGSRRRSGFG
jgi:2-oxoglutarate decarboxylase